MSRFDARRGYKSPEEWTQLAFQKSSEDKLVFIVIGGLLAAGATGLAISPITGAVVAAWAGVSAWQNIKKIGRNQTAITEFGCIAHMLDEDNFRAYATQVIDEQGIESLHRELRFAVENDLEINNAALDYLEDEAPQLLHNPSRLLPQLSQPAVSASIALDRVETSSISFEKEPPDLLAGLAENLGRLIIYGVPGSGKDFFMCNLNVKIKEVHGKKATIFMMDCKNDPKETGYFEGKVDKLYRKRVETMEPIQVYEWCCKILGEYDAFDTGTGFKILEINELAGVNSKLAACPTKKGEVSPIKWWITKIEGYASSGDSYGAKLIFASQNGHNDGIKFSGGTKAIFCPILIARDTTMAETELIMQAKIIPQDKKISSSEMLHHCEASPVNRVIFHGGLNSWVPMPEMKNYSGYNRDKREFIERPGQVDALSEKERAQLTSRTNAKLVGQNLLPSRFGEQTNLVIAKLEASDKTLDNFIKEDLKIFEEEIFNQIKSAIITALRKNGRKDLLKKFNLGTTQ
ncbi:MAG: hypothetical protein KME29_31670 [Calothrix sp. FI2-JRJ7]|jgi:hypothetical protein|nr:hypothetical protein [Calothrix sp. FI2-JRJ7]